MKFDCQEFLKLSIRLVNYEPNEAGYRTAINRAYYACHLIGCEAAAKKGWFTPQFNASDHSGLRRALRHVAWADKLRTLYELREHADYHVDTTRETIDDGCIYCEAETEKTAMVDRKTWEKARAIAEYILPRLQSIAP